MSETLYLSAGDTIRSQTYISASDIWQYISRTLTQAVTVSGNVTLDPSTRVILSAGQPDYAPALQSTLVAAVASITATQLVIISKEDSISATQALQALQATLLAGIANISGSQVTIISKEDSISATQALLAIETNATTNKNSILASVSTISGNVNSVLTSAHGAGAWDAVSVIGEVILSASQPNYPVAKETTLLAGISNISATQVTIISKEDAISATQLLQALQSTLLAGVSNISGTQTTIISKEDAISATQALQALQTTLLGGVSAITGTQSVIINKENAISATQALQALQTTLVNGISNLSASNVTIISKEDSISASIASLGTPMQVGTKVILSASQPDYAPALQTTLLAGISNISGTQAIIITKVDNISGTQVTIISKVDNISADTNTIKNTQITIISKEDAISATQTLQALQTTLLNGISNISGSQTIIINKEDAISATQTLQALQTTLLIGINNLSASNITIISKEDTISASVQALGTPMQSGTDVSLAPNTRVVLSAGQPDYNIPTEVNIILTSAHGSGAWDGISTAPVVLSANQPYFTPASAGDEMSIKSTTLADLMKHSDIIDGKSVDYILEAAMAMVNGNFTISGDTLILYRRDGTTPFSVINKTATTRTRIS